MKTVKPNTLNLIIFRLIIVTTLLVAAVVIQLSTAVFLPLGPFYIIVLVSYASCLAFLMLYLWDSHAKLQANAQIAMDVLIISALVYITGGIGGHLYFLYIFAIIAAGLVLSGRAAFLTASLAAILFGFMADGMFYGLIPYFKNDQPRETSAGLVLYTIFLAWALFFVIAYLFARFGRNARRSREAMEQIQRELQIKERQAEAGQMSALIAHEIRNPLAAISGAVQVLQTELRPAGEAAELMSIVLRESRRVSQTIDQFLNLASPGPQEFALDRPKEIIRETMTLLRMSGDLGDNVVVAGDFAEGSMEFYGSAAQFKQVVWNLLRNALASMPEGGVLRVDCTRDPNRALTLRVVDSGRGMTSQEQERMFEPFFSASPGGHGLGLAVVRRIVDDYRGTIGVQSEPGRGTEFRLTLPDRAAPRKEYSGHGHDPDRRRREEHPRSSDRRVQEGGLPGHDQSRNRQGLRSSGRRRRTTSSSATSRCPRWTGWTFLKAVRKQRTRSSRSSSSPPTAASSRPSKPSRMGALDYVIKPFDIEELKILVAHGFEQRRLREENILLKKTFQSQAELREHDRQEQGHAGGLRSHRTGRLDGFDRADHGRKRDGQGDGGPGHPCPQPALRLSLRLDQLRGPARESPGERALRPHQGQLHRGRFRQEGHVRDRRPRARCSWTRSARCRPGPRSSFSASSRSGRSAGSAGRRRSRSTSGSSPPPTRT